MNVDRAGRYAPLLGCVLALGCGQPVQYEQATSSSLRADGPILDLSKCTNTECEPMGSDRPVLDAPAQVCTTGKTVPLRPIWTRSFEEPPSPTCDNNTEPCFPTPSTLECEGFGACTISVNRLAAASDGTLWMLASIAEPTEDMVGWANTRTALWLVHLDADGGSLGSHILEEATPDENGFVSLYGALALDAEDHLFVATIKSEGELDDLNVWPQPLTQWIAEYDTEGERVGEPIAIVGTVDQATAGNLQIVGAGQGRITVGAPQIVSGGIAQLSAKTHKTAWVQSRRHHVGFTNFVSDSEGRTTVLTLSPDQSPSGRIEQYDPDGRFAWERTLPWRDMRQGFSSAAVSLAPDGDVVVPTLGFFEGEQLHIDRIAPDGTHRWSTTVQVDYAEDMAPNGRTYGPMRATFGDDDEIYVLTGTVDLGVTDGSAPPTVHRAEVIKLSPDGERCELLHFAVQPNGFFENLFPGPDGSFYFSGSGGIGRLAP